MRPWPTKKLGEVCDFVFGYSFRADDFSEAGNGLPVVRIGDIGRSTTDKFYDGNYDKKYLVNKEDILMGLSGSIKVDRWKGETALLNQRIVKVCNFKPDILEGFVFYQLPLILKRLEIQIAQGTVKNVLLPHLSNLQITIAPLPIQRKIVERLDAIRKAQELNDKQISLAHELFQSLLYKELDPRGKNWETRRLRDVCDKIQQTHPQKVFKDEFRYIDIESIDSKTNRILEVKTIEVNKAPSRARKVVKGGDTIFATTRPYLKNIAYISQEFDNCISSTGFCVIRGKRDLVEPKFLFFLSLSNAFISKVLTYQRGATYPAVPDSNIYNLKIPVPHLETQRHVVAKLQAVQDYKKKLLEQKQKLQELFETCLDKAMKGELVN